MSSALWYSRITQINPRSILHEFELKHEVDRTTVCIEFVGQCFFSQFLFSGGGGGGAKAFGHIAEKFSAFLIYQENIHFRGLISNFTKKYGTDFHQIWYNGASYHMTDLRKIWHLSLQKCESRNFSFLFIPLTRTPMFRTAMYSHVRYFDPLVYLFIYL